MFAGISLIINLKAVGMSTTMWYSLHTTPHKILDRISYNSITEACEIKVHYLFFIFFSGPEIAVSKFNGFFRFSMYEP